MKGLRCNPFVLGMTLTRNAPDGKRPITPGNEPVVRGGFFSRILDEDARTVELSFSSEIELERWPGTIEVLDHSAGAVDLTRLQNGGPLLFNHDLDEQLGVVESVTIGADRKGRAVVRFGRGQFASEKWQDVKDGILRNVSVGYRIKEVKLKESREDGTDVYVVTRWEPYEVSLVTVPADGSVGVGRSLIPNNTSPKNQNIMNRQQMIEALRARGYTVADEITDGDLNALFTRSLAPATPAPAPAPSRVQVVNEDPAATRAAGEAAERERVRALFTAGRQYDAADLAQEAVEKGHTVEQFRTALIDHIDKRNKAVVDGTKPIGLSENEARGFSFINLFRALSADPENRKREYERAKFEMEACQAAADQMTHRSAKGTVIPTDVLLTPLQGQRADTIVGAKTGAGYTNAGTNSIQTLLLTSSFIDMLRNRSVLMQRVVELSGLVGNIDIAKQLTGTAAAWIGEDEASPKSDITFGIVSLRPHTVSNRGEITRRLLMQNSLGVEALFRSDLATTLALEIDRAGLYGTNANNEPKGLVEYNVAARYWNANNAPTYAELVAMETALANSNAEASAMSYIATPAFRGYAKTALKFAGIAGTIWEPGGTVNGYGCDVSNQLVAGDIMFGNWADFLVGMWGGLDVTVDPYTHSDKGRIRITQFQDLDFTIRREESFVVGRNLANS